MRFANRWERLHTSQCACSGLDVERFHLGHPGLLGPPGSPPVTTDPSSSWRHSHGRVGAHLCIPESTNRPSSVFVAHELPIQSGGRDWHSPPESCLLEELSSRAVGRWTSIRAWQTDHNI